MGRCEKTGGFTLLEMMITLAIFILLSAAVFGVISGVLQSASTLQDNQNHRDQLAALNAFLNRQLRGLPAQSVLISYRRGEGEGLKQNGIIFGHDEMLTAVDATMQPNGYYTVRLAAFDPSGTPNSTVSPALLFEAAVCRDASTVAWTPLIHDVKQLEWKFQILNSTDWLEMWSDSGNKPNLVEFSMQQAGDLHSSVMDFWIPRIEPLAVVLAPGPATPAPTPTPQPTPPATNAP